MIGARCVNQTVASSTIYARCINQTKLKRHRQKLHCAIPNDHGSLQIAPNECFHPKQLAGFQAYRIAHTFATLPFPVNGDRMPPCMFLRWSLRQKTR